VRPPLAILIALLVVLAGCGGGSSDDKVDGSPTPAKKFKLPTPDSTPSPAEGANGVKLEKVASGMKEPTHVTGLPGDPGTILVTERQGRVWSFRGGEKQPEPFLDLSDQVGTAGGEQGMQSIAFPPDYARTGRFYAFFTDKKDDLRVVEIRGGRERTVLKIFHPTTTPKGTQKTKEDLRVHNGGQLAFGPDGLLYIGTGDAGGQKDPANRSQDPKLLLGKLLRMNPVKDRKPEIYASGLRNPFRFSFDRETGELYIGDVGQNTTEEIDYLPAGAPAGANFGWSCFEGSKQFKPGCEVKDHTPPIIERPSSATAKRCASVTGGYVVRDPELAALNGKYLYADFCESLLRVAVIKDGKVESEEEQGITVPWPSSFGEDDNGRIYVTSYFKGDVYRLVAG
jgi:glucose/arabinose dehydrogenase